MVPMAPSVTSQRPSPRATTWGLCTAMTKGHRPRQFSHPGVAGPMAPEVNTSVWGSRSHPTVASSVTVTPYSCRASTERPIPNVIAMESPRTRRCTGCAP